MITAWSVCAHSTLPNVDQRWNVLVPCLQLYQPTVWLSICHVTLYDAVTLCPICVKENPPASEHGMPELSSNKLFLLFFSPLKTPGMKTSVFTPAFSSSLPKMSPSGATSGTYARDTTAILEECTTMVWFLYNPMLLSKHGISTFYSVPSTVSHCARARMFF